MDDLCNQLLTCKLDTTPKLYHMMIYDFADLSDQYNKSTEFTFNMNSSFELATLHDISELIVYIQTSNAEEILQRMIWERYPAVFIDTRVISSMIDYYIECLCSSI